MSLGCDASSRADQCPPPNPAAWPTGLNLEGGPQEHPLRGSAVASTLREVGLGKFSPEGGQAVRLARSISEHQPPTPVGGGGQPTQTRVFLFLHPNTPARSPQRLIWNLKATCSILGLLPPWRWRGGGCLYTEGFFTPLPLKASGTGSPCPVPTPPPPFPGHVTSRKALGSGRGSPQEVWEGEAAALRMRRAHVTPTPPSGAPMTSPAQGGGQHWPLG